MAIIKTADDDSKEMWIDGEFVAGWLAFEVSDDAKGKLENMIERAVKYGEDKKQKEIKKVLGL